MVYRVFDSNLYFHAPRRPFCNRDKVCSSIWIWSVPKPMRIRMEHISIDPGLILFVELADLKSAKISERTRRGLLEMQDGS